MDYTPVARACTCYLCFTITVSPQLIVPGVLDFDPVREIKSKTKFFSGKHSSTQQSYVGRLERTETLAQPLTRPGQGTFDSITQEAKYLSIQKELHQRYNSFGLK